MTRIDKFWQRPDVIKTLLSPSEDPDSRILRGYCGAREFVVPAHFPLGPKARAEESSCREQAAKVQMA